jgi:ribosomal protein S18 acetylase RimI-like enzyme
VIDLRPIAAGEGGAALEVLDAGSRELWGLGAEELRARYDPLEDLHDPATYYAERRGAFLVVVDGVRIVGTGGIAAMSEDVAELKRLWVLSSYRRQGLGRRLLECLLVFARASDYRSVRLEVATPEMQEAAMSLYRRLGFRPIPAYHEGPCALAMERRL